VIGKTLEITAPPVVSVKRASTTQGDAIEIAEE
jgi:hypothetical protein